MSQFVKRNASDYPDSLYAEVHGLALLRNTIKIAGNCRLHTPEVFDVNEHTLKLQNIKHQSGTPEQMTNLGEGMACLHLIQQNYYGLDRDNFIGLSKQRNGHYDDWGIFFVEKRLEFQLSLITDGKLRKRFQKILQSHKSKLAVFLNEQCKHPSLVHGDLWSGNVLFSQSEEPEEGKVWLIDPAVYFGDREVDIAMSEMFGGFSPEFYRTYDEAYPLSASYQQKKHIYNLYHALNHYNLFGHSYLSKCEEGFALLDVL